MSVIVGEKLTFGQGDGSEIRLVVFGDEHYARYEKEDGYTVVYESAQRRFCYADIANGHLVSTGVSARVGAPAGIRRHLRESSAIRRAKRTRGAQRRASASSAASSGPNFTLGPSSGLLAGRQLSIGKVRGLTILVNFQDVASTVTQADVNDLLNGANYTKNGNACSANEYFKRVSTGKLDYTNAVVGPFKLSQPRQYYVEHLLIEEALDLAVASGVNLKDFDSRNQGIVDALNVLYAGQTQYLGELWPHNFNIDLKFGAVRTDLYLLTSMGRDASELSIGTFCHENGHLLCRFPDMYDYGERDGDDVASEGIGAYCLMGSGNHNDNGHTPSPVCGYLRYLAGWCDNVVLLDQPAQLSAKHGDYNTVMKYETDKPNEYFIVENRSKSGLDAGLPASGLAVYHCDILGSNELQDGTADRHYQCALLQADGRRDLERAVNRGDGTDLFGAVQGTAVSAETNPSSRLWDGSDSGLEISGVSAPGEVMKFTVGGSADPVELIRAEAAPKMAIPDNKTAGVVSQVAITQPGNAATLTVAVDITHTWIGDLVVELKSPSGKTALLHNGTGGNRQNLLATFTSTDTTSLASLVGEPVHGNWTLTVRDRAAEDVGVLNRWSLELTTQRPSAPVANSAKPNLPIPDAASAGVQSTVPLAGSGVAARLKVSVEITHPWIGDLRVQLVSPSGRTATLHGQVGGSQRDLKMTYDSETPSSPLAPLVGQSIAGNWTLRVADLMARDTGTFKAWSIEATRT
jgi:M6 family metalloprotease-like protein